MLVALACAGFAVQARAVAADPGLCQAAIAQTEPSSRLPRQMLTAIGTVESGRPDKRTGALAPWPWAVNVAGVGYSYDTEEEAIAAVRSAQSAGVQSIDVGCMQINLLHHPDAFSSLERAFDPEANVRYAASFLTLLHVSSGDWSAAVAAYHSSTPAIGAEYLGRVAGVWRLAAMYGVVAPVNIPAATVTGPAARLSEADIVDPQHVLTPSFRQQLVAEAAFRRHRNEMLGISPALESRGAPPRVPAQARVRSRRLRMASLRP